MLIGFTGGLWLWNSSLFTKADSSSYAKAKIINVNNALVHTYGVVNQGDQELKLEILNGKHTGQVVSAYNTLLGDPELDWLFSPDEQALISTYEENGKVLVDVLGPYRLQTEGFLALVFFILLIGVAGWVGVKAILSFIFSILLIWKVLIPLSLAGYDPILVSLFIVSVLTGAITLLVGGVTRKGITAFFGGFLGLLTTCILALLFAPKFYLTGTSRLFAKSLIFSNPQLDLYRFFIAGIFIASSGAVMDLAMDIAAAMQEIKKHNPTITSKQLFLSGIKVGQAVVGTMTTTLLLAYSGGYMMMLAHFISQGISARVMINSTFFSSEALNTLVGSFGLVTVAPFSAFVGAFLFSNSWYDTKTLQHVISKHTHSHKDHI
jgi:uncharacterized membrane protein